MMQNLIAAAIVLYALWVVLRKYLPKAWRRAFSRLWLRSQLRLCAPLAAIMRVCGMPGLGRRLQAFVQRRAERADDEVPEAGSCGGCDGCSSGTGSKTGSKTDSKPGAKDGTAAGVITPEALRRTIRPGSGPRG